MGTMGHGAVLGDGFATCLGFDTPYQKQLALLCAAQWFRRKGNVCMARAKEIQAEYWRKREVTDRNGKRAA